jgi:hypothetical protein
MRCVVTIGVAFVLASASASEVPRIPPHAFNTCEIQKLADQLNPPARFKGYRAQFSCDKVNVSFEHKNGPEAMDMWIIRDNGKVAAVMPTAGFHGGWLYLLSWDPAALKKELTLPKERWHCDTQPGPSIRTEQFMPSKKWDSGESNAWHIADGGEKLVLIRAMRGDVKINEWELKYKGKVDEVSTFVLRVDPVFGYVVDATWETGVNPPVNSAQYCSLYPPYISNPWVDTHEIVLTCLPGSTGYTGHFNNHAAVGKCGSGGWSCRNLGFAAYLDTRTGWSVAMPAIGGEARLSVCNVHADQDFIVQWPANPTPDAEGFVRNTYQTRLCWLPPELTKHLREKVEIKFKDGRCVIIPAGKIEDFEDQPASVASMKPGMTFTEWPSATVADTEAHSGKKSLVVRGRVWPNLPQLVLKPNQKYRITAWIKVVGPTPEQKENARQDFVANVERQKAAHAKKMDKLRKDGKESEITEFKAPVWDDAAEAEGWISGDFYEWTPHSRERDRPIATTRVKEGEGWKQVSVDFVSEKWGPFSDLTFHCSNSGTAYVDDFLYEEVKEP